MGTLTSSSSLSDSSSSNTLQQQAAAAIPPGYAYFYGQPAMQNLAQAAYGYNPAAAAMSVPTTATQFQQKAAYGSSYGNYDAIGQPGGAGKDFASSYSATNAVAAAAAAAAKKPGSNSGTGTGHQYWGNSSLSQWS